MKPMNALKGLLLTINGIALFFAIIIAFFSFLSLISGGGIDRAGSTLCMSAPAVIVLSILSNYLIRADWDRKKERTELACPKCGYNMRGLTEAKCPECGAAFTLDQLRLK